MLIISGYMYIDPSVLELFMGELKLLANAVRQRDGNLSYNAAGRTIRPEVCLYQNDGWIRTRSMPIL